MAQISDFAQAFRNLTTALEQDVGTIRFAPDIINPFRATVTPTSSDGLEQFAKVIQRKGVLMRLDGPAIYVAVSTALEHPPCDNLAKVVYYWMDNLPVYTDRKKALAALRLQDRTVDWESEVRRRQKSIFSQLLPRLREFLFDEQKHVGVRRLVAQLIIALCIDHTNGWRVLRGAENRQTVGSLLRKSKDEVLRVILSDIVRHLSISNIEMNQIWDRTDEDAMDFPNSAEITTPTVEKLFRTTVHTAVNDASNYEKRKSYQIREIKVPDRQIHSSASDTILVLDNSGITLFLPDRSRQKSVFLQYEIPISGKIEMDLSRSPTFPVGLSIRFKRNQGFWRYRSKKYALSQIDLQFMGVAHQKQFEVAFYHIQATLTASAVYIDPGGNSDTQPLSIPTFRFGDNADDTDVEILPTTSPAEKNSWNRVMPRISSGPRQDNHISSEHVPRHKKSFPDVFIDSSRQDEVEAIYTANGKARPFADKLHAVKQMAADSLPNQKTPQPTQVEERQMGVSMLTTPSKKVNQRAGRGDRAIFGIGYNMRSGVDDPSLSTTLNSHEDPDYASFQETCKDLVNRAAGNFPTDTAIAGKLTIDNNRESQDLTVQTTQRLPHQRSKLVASAPSRPRSMSVAAVDWSLTGQNHTTSDSLIVKEVTEASTRQEYTRSNAANTRIASNPQGRLSNKPVVQQSVIQNRDEEGIYDLDVSSDGQSVKHLSRRKPNKPKSRQPPGEAIRASKLTKLDKPPRAKGPTRRSKRSIVQKPTVYAEVSASDEGVADQVRHMKLVDRPSEITDRERSQGPGTTQNPIDTKDTCNPLSLTAEDAPVENVSRRELMVGVTSVGNVESGDPSVAPSNPDVVRQRALHHNMANREPPKPPTPTRSKDATIIDAVEGGWALYPFSSDEDCVQDSYPKQDGVVAVKIDIVNSHEDEEHPPVSEICSVAYPGSISDAGNQPDQKFESHKRKRDDTRWLPADQARRQSPLQNLASKKQKPGLEQATVEVFAAHIPTAILERTQDSGFRLLDVINKTPCRLVGTGKHSKVERHAQILTCRSEGKPSIVHFDNNGPVNQGNDNPLGSMRIQTHLRTGKSATIRESEVTLKSKKHQVKAMNLQEKTHPEAGRPSSALPSGKSRRQPYSKETNLERILITAEDSGHSKEDHNSNRHTCSKTSNPSHEDLAIGGPGLRCDYDFSASLLRETSDRELEDEFQQSYDLKSADIIRLDVSTDSLTTEVPELENPAESAIANSTSQGRNFKFKEGAEVASLAHPSITRTPNKGAVKVPARCLSHKSSHFEQFHIVQPPPEQLEAANQSNVLTSTQETSKRNSNFRLGLAKVRADHEGSYVKDSTFSPIKIHLANQFPTELPEQDTQFQNTGQSHTRVEVRPRVQSSDTQAQLTNMASVQKPPPPMVFDRGGIADTCATQFQEVMPMPVPKLSHTQMASAHGSRGRSNNMNEFPILKVKQIKHVQRISKPNAEPMLQETPQPFTKFLRTIATISPVSDTKPASDLKSVRRSDSEEITLVDTALQVVNHDSYAVSTFREMRSEASEHTELQMGSACTLIQDLENTFHAMTKSILERLEKEAISTKLSLERYEHGCRHILNEFERNATSRIAHDARKTICAVEGNEKRLRKAIVSLSEPRTNRFNDCHVVSGVDVDNIRKHEQDVVARLDLISHEFGLSTSEE